MAKQVQLRRGTTTEHNSFTGAVGEATVDTTLNTIRVHDGTTVGGTRLARYSEIVPPSRVITAGSGLSGGGDLSADRTISLSGTVAHINVVQSYTKAQRGTVVTLTGTGTVTPVFADGNNFKITLSGTTTLTAPTGLTEGQAGMIAITQDGTGNRALSFSGWKFPGGTAPNMTLTSGATDLLAYYVESSTRVSARLVSDLK